MKKQRRIMANFSIEFDFDKIMKEISKSGSLAGRNMIDAGIVVLEKAIVNAARKYHKTGILLRSIRYSKAKLTKSGAVIGDVYFKGNYTTKRYENIPIWIIALFLEHGTKYSYLGKIKRKRILAKHGIQKLKRIVSRIGYYKISPKHWVEAAIQNSNERIEKVMYEAFENSLAQVRFF
jgi:hypothetical protein